MKITPANGITGVLINTSDGLIVFRVYDSEHNFIDYDIDHSDLSVTICDEDAYFYDNGITKKLDHCPLTLGVNECSTS